MRPLWASWAIAGASPRSSQATASRSSSAVIIGSHQLWFAFERHQGLGHVVAQVRRVEGADYDTVYTGLSEKKVQAGLRSEEHTSELQSRGHLVCRLLLEKKKKR